MPVRCLRRGDEGHDAVRFGLQGSGEMGRQHVGHAFQHLVHIRVVKAMLALKAPGSTPAAWAKLARGPAGPGSEAA